jgi:predicted nucleic acid-binding protein
MKDKRTRTSYVDSSVFGGVFDDEFEVDSRAFVRQAEQGRFTILTSVLVAGEIASAPALVRELYDKLIPKARILEISEPALSLQSAYLAEGIVSEKWADDALHVAIAAVAGADLIVSWNFRHIVHLDKISCYNEVNITKGYRPLAIHSPSEVISYEDEEEV